MVLRGMYQANIDLGIMQETNTINGVYLRSLAGFYVLENDAPSCHCGGVTLFYKELQKFAV